MKLMRIMLWIAAMAVVGVQAQEIVVSWETNGVLLAEGMEPGTEVAVEWSSNLTEGFTNNPAPFAGLVADSNGMMRVAIPMFFRVRGTLPNIYGPGDELTLTVVSDHAEAIPGSQTVEWGEFLVQTVSESPVTGGAGTRYVCVGATVNGNDYTQISPTVVTLTLINNATLTWEWQTEYELTTGTSGDGSVTAADGWYDESSDVVLTAAAADQYRFSHWSGDTNGCSIADNVITSPMTQPREIVANFEMDQVSLTVVSAYGGTDPGSQTVESGTVLVQTVSNSPVDGGEGTRYVCVAGTVVGNDYTQVSPTNVSLTLTNNATLTWDWQTQYELTTGTNGSGSVTAADGWYASGSNVVLTANAAGLHQFTHWSGDTNGCSIADHEITAPMTQARTIVANFEATVIEGMELIPAGINSGTNPLNPQDIESYSEFYPQTYALMNESAFYMDATEVTKAQWDEVYLWALSNGYSFSNTGVGVGTNHPVQFVNWYDCAKWCNARSEMDGKTPCYTVGGGTYKAGEIVPVCDLDAGGYRLPTSAEWEFAARGGVSGKRFPWGGDTITHDDANYNAAPFSYSYDVSPTYVYHPDYDDGSQPYTSPAGSFAANGYGLYDMSGNVYEWCNDLYGDTQRVRRGGSWSQYANAARCGNVSVRNANDEQYDIGFRAVLPVE